MRAAFPALSNVCFLERQDVRTSKLQVAHLQSLAKCLDCRGIVAQHAVMQVGLCKVLTLLIQTHLGDYFYSHRESVVSGASLVSQRRCCMGAAGG